MNSTQRTYTDKQLEERGREVVMEAAKHLLAALQSPVHNSEKISAFAEAVHAGTAMVNVEGSIDDEIG